MLISPLVHWSQILIYFICIWSNEMLIWYSRRRKADWIDQRRSYLYYLSPDRCARSDQIETDESMDSHHRPSNTHVLWLHSSVILFPSTKRGLRLNLGSWLLITPLSSAEKPRKKGREGGREGGAWGETPEHADRNKGLPWGFMPPTATDSHSAVALQAEVRTT